MSADQIRRAYLRLLRLWRLEIPSAMAASLRLPEAVGQVVDHFASGQQSLPFGGFRLELSELFVREHAARPQMVLVPDGLRRIVAGLRRKTCFLGCRFRRPHKQLLEKNLRRLLQCYGLDLEADDADVGFRSLFPEIVAKIRRAPLCILDARYTRRRPNVFIECGVSYSLGRLTILTAHRGDLPATGRGVPTDLHGMVYTPYSSYEDLVEQLSLRLPRALREHYRGR